MSGADRVGAMAILNENLEWSRLSMDLSLRDAFQGTPVKTLISPGQLLCRFITAKSKKHGIRGNEIFRSPWWLEWDTVAGMLHRWRMAGVKAREVIRGRLAITLEFSERLDSLVQIKMTKPAFGWKGPARYQEDKRQKLTYIGGAIQYYLPNLAGDSDGLSSDVAYMHYFGWVDDLG